MKKTGKKEKTPQSTKVKHDLKEVLRSYQQEKHEKLVQDLKEVEIDYTEMDCG